MVPLFYCTGEFILRDSPFGGDVCIGATGRKSKPALSTLLPEMDSTCGKLVRMTGNRLGQGSLRFMNWIPTAKAR